MLDETLGYSGIRHGYFAFRHHDIVYVLQSRYQLSAGPLCQERVRRVDHLDDQQLIGPGCRPKHRRVFGE